MMMTSTPSGVTRRPVGDVCDVAALGPEARRGGFGRRSIHFALGLSVTIALQGITASSAAVATLPPGSEAAVTMVEKTPRPEPALALAKDPALFSSILDGSFPSVRIEQAAKTDVPPEHSVKPAKSDPVPLVPMDGPDETMEFGARTAPRWLVHTILHAAHIAGVDPVYLMTLADVESSLSPGAKAPTSTAEGLFQFIDRTWLETVRAHAAEYGFGAAGEAIQLVDGDPVVNDEKMRNWVMGLRRDPYFSALMACELIKDIERELQSSGERELAEAELYLAHFLGANSAVRFLEALDEQPNTPAAKIFPKAAKANVGLFTEAKGRKRRNVTLAEFYDRIDSKIVRRLNRYDDLTPTAFAATQPPSQPQTEPAVQPKTAEHTREASAFVN
jgi:Transglycosylase SLT domain